MKNRPPGRYGTCRCPRREIYQQVQQFIDGPRGARACLAVLAIAATALPLSAEAKPLTFGVQPQWSRERTQRMFQPLVDYLSEKTGQEIRLRVSEDYGGLLDEIASGVIDLAKIAPYGYVVARKTMGVRIFASELTMGRPFYHGLIITRRDSGLRSVEDLRGRSFSYTDPNSTSGFIYPRALLVSRGMDPDAYFAKSHYAGSHDACIRGVAAKDVDACATWDVALEDETNSALFGVDGDELQVVYRTEPIPNDAYVARSDLDPAIVEAVQSALFELSRDPELLKSVIDWKTRIDGFVPGDDAAYEVVRQKVALKDLKRRLAVLPFEAMGTELGVEDPGQAAAELLGTILFDARRFLMTERSQLDKALEEQRLSLQDLVDASTAIKVGHVVGADVLLTGSVMKIDGKVHITARLIETESARVVSAQHGKGDTLEQVATQVANDLAAEHEVTGFVLKVRNTENVALDLGSLQGVKAGDVLKLYREGEALIHPLTQKVLGTEEILLGEIVAVRTTPDTGFGKVVESTETVREGMRVRTLSKGEVTSRRSTDRIVAGYVSEEKTKYQPWVEKYAWRVAAIATIPAVWALAWGDDREKLIYGGIAGALWLTSGGIYLYGAVSRKDEPAVGVGGTF
ncbi:MAG: phosphate/phosphite/phosphonate ABC transporter substrate-binding protein [Deltaproteobacteria bacterium]|nr:phosphate/phosphite/phosphonate ABC transporter substrate-binding protein [Deltaproteobacteria bacterium]